MRSISFKKLFALLFFSLLVSGQQINLDTQVKGSRLPTWGSDSGTANAYVITTIAPLGPTLRTGSSFEFSAAHANTSSSTLNVDSSGAIAIKKMSSGSLVNLVSGDIAAGQIHIYWYDGTEFQCVTCFSGGAGGGVSSFTGDGTLINNSGSTGAVTVTLGNAGAHKWWGNNTGSTAAPGYQSIGLGDLPSLVSSLSGDGSLITNSGSTGSVTLALGNAGAHKWWGNNTGSTAAPGYQAIGTSDLPGSGQITINGIVCTLASSCSVNGSGSSSQTIWPTFNQPSTSNFTWFNQGSSTATNKSDRIVVDVPDGGGGGDHLRGLYSNTALPSPPYTVEAGIVVQGQNVTNIGALLAYAGLYDTVSTKAAGAAIKLQGGTAGVRADHWNSPTSFGAVVGPGGDVVSRGALCFVRITDDGTTRKYWWSNDGKDYNFMTSEATNTFVTPTNAFFGFYNENGQTLDAIYSVFHFQVAASILPQFAN